jgi:prepilin-type N-terminal cleavage/methylation domain-containing protein
MSSTMGIVRARAFTLVEILVVVVIIGAISALIIPQIAGRDDLKAAAGARVLIADLSYAQNLALSTSRVVYVRFDEDEQRYTLYRAFPLTDANRVVHPVTQGPFVVSFGRPRDAMEKLVLSDVDMDGQEVLAFDEAGAPLAVQSGGGSSALDEGSVVVNCGTRTVTVRIDADTGRLTAIAGE